MKPEENLANGLTVARPAAVRDRLSCVLAVYHQSHGAQPVLTDGRWGRWLEQGEQPWSRRVVVGPDWSPVDAGWLAASGAGYLVIENNEGKGQLVQPTETEKASVSARIVEVGVAVGQTITPAFLVRPGESLPGEPADLFTLRLRCKSGSARCTVTVFPS